jgi:hypothetical protein
LQEYVEAHNKKGKKMVGGIVANTNPRDYTGRWVCYKGQSSDLVPDDFSNWETLEI